MAVVTDAQNKKLEKEGKRLAGSRVEWATGGYGLLVQTGSVKPDIGTVRPPRLWSHFPGRPRVRRRWPRTGLLRNDVGFVGCVLLLPKRAERSS